MGDLRVTVDDFVPDAAARDASESPRVNSWLDAHALRAQEGTYAGLPLLVVAGARTEILRAQLAPCLIYRNNSE